ncbi:MAG: laccase domain-containing protein [Bacteroidales bacterium]|nr:laccase domain-containing protein [Bacteroidales bacterium]
MDTSSLVKYPFGEGVEAFSTRRDSVLPYHVIQGHQVHDRKVAVVDSPLLTREDLEGYDAFVTSLRGVAIGVRTADCVPVLLYDRAKKVVAAVHSGWKGTVLQISRHTISVMREEFGTDPEDLTAWIGPAIGKKSFQVGEEVVEKFRNEGFPMEIIWEYEGEGDGSPMSGGHHIDLFHANRWILEKAGIRPQNIGICGIDTYADPAFFSARREGVSCGRIINSIRLLP